MYETSCNPNLTFLDIIKKAPNLEDIYLLNSKKNIIYEKTWIKDLLKYINGKTFQSLTVIVYTIELDVKNLVKFIETKCNREKIVVDLRFNIDLLDEDEDGQILAGIQRKVSEYFDDHSEEESVMEIGYDGVDGYERYSLEKIKKPKRPIIQSRGIKRRNFDRNLSVFIYPNFLN
uniref:Uncharacterized protein n=1 Tax=Panagrolaimus superbus TaxID=310955 RepID=A0A914YSR0_9BILA